MLFRSKQTVTRFNVSYKISQSVSIRSRIDVVRINREDAEDNNGVALIQDIIYKPVDQPFSINVRFALFDSDDYDSRIYAYENDVYGLFSIPSYYYSGMRYYLNVRYNPMRKLSLYARIAQTVYNHQQTVGSGLDEINGNSKADLHLAVKWEF